MDLRRRSFLHFDSANDTDRLFEGTKHGRTIVTVNTVIFFADHALKDPVDPKELEARKTMFTILRYLASGLASMEQGVGSTHLHLGREALDAAIRPEGYDQAIRVRDHDTHTTRYVRTR